MPASVICKLLFPKKKVKACALFGKLNEAAEKSSVEEGEVLTCDTLLSKITSVKE